MENYLYYKKKDQFVLGLDLGIGSCGWAVINLDQGRIEDLGSLIFESGEEGASKAADRASQQRRAKRSLHRLTRRRKQRKEAIKKFLDSIQFLNRKDIDEYFLHQDNANNIVELRYKGIDEKLTKKEILSILIYLANNRGYKEFYELLSSDEEDKNAEKEMELAKEKVETLYQKGHYRTIGEMIFKDDEFKKLDNNHLPVIQYHNKKSYEYLIPRKYLYEELKMILNKQSNYYEELSPENIDIINHLVFSQRNFEAGPGPKKDRSISMQSYNNQIKGHQKYTGFNDLIGFCTFYPKEKRWIKNSIVYDEYVLINFLSQMTFYAKATGEIYQFDSESLMELLLYFFDCKGKVLKKELDSYFAKKDITIDSTESGKRTFALNYIGFLSNQDIFDDKYIQMFREEIINNNYTYSDSLSNQIGIILGQYITPEVRKEHLDKLLNAECPNGVIAFKSLGVSNLSLKYMLEAIQAFAQGIKYGDFQAHFNKENILAEKKLMVNGRLIAIQDPDLNRNPVVYRSINQARKLINKVINDYNIVRINIEVASEVGKSFKQKHEEDNYQKGMEDQNIEIEKELQDELDKRKIDIPMSAKLKEKFVLYKSQDARCMYTNEPIVFEDMVRSNRYQVEHIIPQSIILDNTINNKVLVLRNANVVKNNRLPLECFGEMQKAVGSEFTEKQYLDNILKLSRKKNGGISKKKYQYLKLKELDSESLQNFVSRNINDTRYITRYITNYLTTAFAQDDQTKNIQINAIKGSVTSRFRKRWLTKYTRSGAVPTIYALENKGRELHYYHHAVDAVILANIEKKYIILANTYDTLSSIKRDKNLSDNDKKFEMDKVIQNTVGSLRTYQGMSENYIRSLIDKEFIPAICKNLYSEVPVRVPLDIKMKDENGCYKFNSDLRYFRKLLVIFKDLTDSISNNEICDPEKETKFNDYNKKLGLPFSVTSGIFYKGDTEKKLNVNDLRKLMPDLRDYIESIEQIDQSTLYERCLEYYGDEDFAKSIKLPYIVYKEDKKLRGNILGSDMQKSLSEAIEKLKLQDKVKTMEDLISYIEDPYQLKCPYYVKKERGNRSGINYSIYLANRYFCAEVYTNPDGKVELRGIKYVDVRKENGKMILLKPLPNEYSHICYLFNNEYISVKNKRNKLLNNGFGAYRSINSINENNILIRLYSNKNLLGKDIRIKVTENIVKYSINILGHLEGEITCGDQLLFSKKKK